MNAFAMPSDFILNSEKTLYIVDGDSISMQMRIKGIDTPEIGQTCQKTHNQILDCGQLAKKYLQQILQNLPGKLSIKAIGTDHYQRILVKVYKDKINIGKYMVEQGMAFSHKRNYRQAQNLAREKKRGFWGFYKPPIKPYKWRKLNR